MKINEINKVGVETKHELLQQISVYDFLTLFSKIVERSKLPYFGILLHKNSLPIPLISCTLNKGLRKYHSKISMLENILIDKKVKLIINTGTPMSEKKGKTELITNVFGIEYKNCSFLECDFHIGCVSFYTNLSSMTAEQSVIIADIHG